MFSPSIVDEALAITTYCPAHSRVTDTLLNEGLFR